MSITIFLNTLWRHCFIRQDNWWDITTANITYWLFIDNVLPRVWWQLSEVMLNRGPASVTPDVKMKLCFRFSIDSKPCEENIEALTSQPFRFNLLFKWLFILKEQYIQCHAISRFSICEKKIKEKRSLVVFLFAVVKNEMTRFPLHVLR